MGWVTWKTRAAAVIPGVLDGAVQGEGRAQCGDRQARFLAGIRFTDVDDLNRQAWAWAERRNQRIHRTTGQRPIERWTAGNLAAATDELGLGALGE